MRISCSRLMKFGPQLRELRIHLCQTSEESKGVRDFVETHYVKMKQENPKLPILIRECSGVQPRLWARYEHGKEKSVPLTNVTGDQVLKQIEGYGSAQF